MHDKKGQRKYDPDRKDSQDQTFDDVTDCFGIHKKKSPFQSVFCAWDGKP
jgi:hypothetical protein